jgi:hypothetical protein
MAFFWQVFFSDRKVSRHRRPSSAAFIGLDLAGSVSLSGQVAQRTGI